jgi:hypothetical protein
VTGATDPRTLVSAMTDETNDTTAIEAAAPDEAPAGDLVQAPDESPHVTDTTDTAGGTDTAETPEVTGPAGPADTAAATEAADAADLPAHGAPVPVGRSREAIVSDIEAVAATPDELPDGRQPDDRTLVARLKQLDAELELATPLPEAAAEKDLRRRVDAARKSYAVARSQRAELRAVTRARAGETKRGLLVEAFTLARLVDPAGVAVPTPAVAAAPLRRATLRPSPAMFARRPAPVPGSPGAQTPDATEPTAEPTAEQAAEPTAEQAAEPTAEQAAEPTAEQAAEQAAEPTAEQAAEPTPGAQPPEEPAVPEVDLVAIGAQAQRLQQEWRDVGFAGRETEDEIATLFRSYLDVVFNAQRKVHSAHISARKALVREARSLAARAAEAEAKDLSALIRDAKTLQEQWKQGTAAPRGPENTSWQQFSGALREVFTRREAVHGSAIDERKEIVAAVNALVQERDAFRAVKGIGPLLKRWGGAGPVPGKVYAELKAKLDQDLTAIRTRADAERARRDADDDKSQAERAKNASRIVREAERGRDRKQVRSGPPGRSTGGSDRSHRDAVPSGGSALAAAFAQAFSRTSQVQARVGELERTVSELEQRLTSGQRPDAMLETSQTGQGFRVNRSVDVSASDPAKITRQLEIARAALERGRAELSTLQSTSGSLGVK